MTDTETQVVTTPLSDLLKRDESGRFTKRDESPAEPAASAPIVTEPVAVETPATAPQPSLTGDTKPGPSPVPEKVETDEVKALKAELARVRQTRRDIPAAVRPEPVRPPSVFEDEQGYTDHLTSQFEEKLLEAKIAMSEENAREKFPDLKEVMGTVGEGDETLHVNWVEAVKANPRLFDQFKRSANPVVFAYQELKRQADIKEIGDPKAYKEKLRQELLAELKAGGAQPAPTVTPAIIPAITKPDPIIPDTLAGAPSKGSREAPTWNGPKPLGDITKASPQRQAARAR